MKNSKPVIGCSYKDSKNEFSIIIVGKVVDGVFTILDQSQIYCFPGDDRNPDSKFRKKIAELSKKWDAEVLDIRKSFRHL